MLRFFRTSDVGNRKPPGRPGLEKAYPFLLRLVPTLDKFPRRQKFLLADRSATRALAALESRKVG